MMAAKMVALKADLTAGMMAELSVRQTAARMADLLAATMDWMSVAQWAGHWAAVRVTDWARP